jgi:hypothetical protein
MKPLSILFLNYIVIRYINVFFVPSKCASGAYAVPKPCATGYINRPLLCPDCAYAVRCPCRGMARRT